MKFYSDSDRTVWDKDRKRVLCVFKNNELETDDARIISILSQKYKSDEVIEFKNDNYEDWQIEELKEEAKRKGLKYYARMKKETLIEALKDLEMMR
jgi:hypothetical protein